MKKTTCGLWLAVGAVLAVSCKKDHAKGNTVNGDWKFVSLEVHNLDTGIAINALRSDTSLLKLDFIAGDAGTLSLDNGHYVANDITYQTTAPVWAIYLHNTATPDTVNTGYAITGTGPFQQTGSYLIRNDSMIFSNGVLKLPVYGQMRLDIYSGGLTLHDTRAVYKGDSLLLMYQQDTTAVAKPRADSMYTYHMQSSSILRFVKMH